LLVEKLPARCLLKVVCGTDTLGVNVPIRTVIKDKLKTLVKPRAMTPVNGTDTLGVGHAVMDKIKMLVKPRTMTPLMTPLTPEGCIRIPALNALQSPCTSRTLPNPALSPMVDTRLIRTFSQTPFSPT
jgi:hypothetical protein